VKDLRAYVLIHGIARDKIDRTPEQFRQFILKVKERESQSCSRLQLVEQVKITAATLFASPDRPEHLQARNAVAFANLTESLRVEGDACHAAMISDCLIAHTGGATREKMGSMALHITGDTAADDLLTNNPLALLVGMLLDQQVPMETAFAGPLKIADRTGATDAAAIASMDPEEFLAAFKETPAVHRFPGSMATRVQTLCQTIVDDWGGDAAALWTSGDPDGAEVLKRLKKLPGFGEQKAKIFLALLGKQYGFTGDGWREAAGDYGVDGSFRSVADIVSPESLTKVREHKKAMKAAAARSNATEER